MGKAILVMNMPNCCDECFALDDNGDYPMCRITQEQRGYTFRTREQRMDSCPLKPVPEKEYADTGIVEVDEFAAGWNACIDEILGDKL